MKKYILLLFLGIIITVNAQTEMLTVPNIKPHEKREHWCAPACAECVFRFNNINMGQCAIMDHLRKTFNIYGGTNGYGCCNEMPSGFDHPCDKEGVPLGFFDEKHSIKEALNYFGNGKLVCNTAGSLSTHDISTQLGGSWRQPIIAQLKEFGDLEEDAHAVVISGIKEGNTIYYMDPGRNGVIWQESYNTFKSGWTGSLLPSCSSRGEPCGPLFEDHCTNGRRDPNLGETGIDCGGNDCPACTLCNNCILDPGEDAMDCGGTCTPCNYIGGVSEEVNITNTAQLRSEMKAFNKITAGSATTVASEKDVTFITEKTGSIVLLPGFKAEEGSTFRTQTKDLSQYKRRCGAICYNYTLPDHLTKPPENLYISNLLNAVEMRYEIYENNERIYSYILNISRDGDFNLWDCLANKYDASNVPRGRHFYKMKYSIYYCNGAANLNNKEHNFYVDYDYEKSLNEKSKESDTDQSSSSNNLKIQAEKGAPSLSIIPNPNSGTFQLETNFSLTDIGNLKITNLMGATVYETQNVASPTIQLPHPAAGTFFVVMVLKDGAVLARKMVVR